MKLRTMLLGTTLALALPMAASAETTGKEGLYLGLQGGVNWLQDVDFTIPAVTNKVPFNEDWVALGEIGYRFGDGLRAGLELAYNAGTIGTITGGPAGRAGGKGSVDAWTGMLVGYYDFDTGSALRPYVGAGVGFASVSANDVRNTLAVTGRVDDEDTGFAYQLGAGVAYEFSPNTELTVGYRYLASNGLEMQSSTGAGFKFDYQSHAVLVGLRYTFGAPEAKPVVATPTAAPVVEAAPPAPPPAAIARNYMVFFDFDKSDLTVDAKQTLDSVARDAKAGNIAAVNVTGHADRSGSDQYNVALSQRRAESVRGYLVSLGLAAGTVGIDGKGESEPLVGTADGVREPSNRRAVIIFP
jgi:OmpA-OmpF porin, OOP family